MKKTLVLGASPNPERYSFKAVAMLNEYGHPVAAHGLRKGEINETDIVNELPHDKDFDTVTIYLNANNQKDFEDYILSLKPQRVVFNPGTENPEFAKRLTEAGITPVEACTLVMLRTGQF